MHFCIGRFFSNIFLEGQHPNLPIDFLIPCMGNRDDGIPHEKA